MSGAGVGRRAARLVGVVSVVAVGGSAVAGCDGTTDPEFASGTLSVEIAAMTSSGPPETWVAEGTCGSEGFVLGSATCAVGSAENQYWLALGIVANGDGTYDTVGAVHPKEGGTCEASSETGSTCTVEIRRGWPGEDGPPALYLLTAGTVTADTGTVAGVPRLFGTFEGIAVHVGGDGEPLAITNGAFDVPLTP